jgi:hypothetical protein
LKPASGTIEAKSRHPNHLPPTAPPVEIADQPDVSMKTDPANPALLDSRPSTSRRVRPTRKGLTEHPVKFYILVGLALGAGIVVTYWAYWYLPFFHR